MVEVSQNVTKSYTHNDRLTPLSINMMFFKGKGKNMEDEKKEENVTRVSRLLRPTLHLSRGINVAHLTNTKNVTYTKKLKIKKDDT